MGQRLAVVALCGCNQIFGLTPTQSAYFDAPTDAPFMCPLAGETPQFSPLLHQIFPQNCVDYSISRDRGVALMLCVDTEPSGYLFYPYEDPIDVPPATRLLDLDDLGYAVEVVQIAPEGDELLALYSTAAFTYQFRTYHRQDGRWMRGSDFLPAGGFLQFSTPTRRPRHVMYTAVDGSLRELVEDATGKWTEVGMVSQITLGISGAPSSPQLSADGLRLMVSAMTPDSPNGAHVLYTDRPSLAAAFRKADKITGVPYVSDMFMTEDCSRVYFSGLDSVFYVQRL